MINNNIDNAFYLRFCPEKRQVNIKIISQSVDHIPALLDQIEDTIGPAYNWELQWNFVNTPKEIKENIALRRRILKMFAANVVLQTMHSQTSSLQNMVDIKPVVDISLPGVVTPNFSDSDHDRSQNQKNQLVVPKSEVERMASKVNAHVLFHGAAPNFADQSLKGMSKSINYIKSVLGVQHISDSEAEAVVKRVALLRK